MTPWLSILGVGEEGGEAMTPAARALLAGAAHVWGGERHLRLAAPPAGVAHPWPSPMQDAYPRILAQRGQAVVVLASGDPFWFGVGTALAGLVAPGEFRCIPAPSVLALACARLGWAAQDVSTVSLCGRPLATLRPALQPGARLLVLSADAATPAAVMAALCAHGFGPSRLHLMEGLGGRAERLRSLLASDPCPSAVLPLNVLAVEVVAGPDARPLPLAAGLPDEMFAHDGQLTRREIRAVTLSSLAPHQGGLLWDIGAGSGSIGIEWMLRHSACRAVAVERHPERVARIAANALALGVPGLAIAQGAAPAALHGLPAPDAVFIGGGATGPGVLDAAWAALRPGGRLVANAVTLETETVLVAAHGRLGGSLTRIGVERLDRIGGMHGYRPAMTVTQWAAVRP